MLVKGFAWHCGGAAEGRLMASLQERNGSYRVRFCHNGKLHSFTIGKVRKDEAENKARQVD